MFFLIEDYVNVKIHEAIYYYGTNLEWDFQDILYPYNTLYYIFDGDGILTVDDTEIPLERGYLYLIPAGMLHGCRCISEISKIYADVSVELVPGYDIFSRMGKVLRMPFDKLETEMLLHACRQQTVGAALVIKGIITKAMGQFVDMGVETVDEEILQFRPMLRDIEENLSPQRKVSEIAGKYNWDPSVLTRKFKKVFGCSMKQYMEALLLNRLKSQLIGSNRSMKELAERFGFCDQYYLCSFFKKFEKVSPTQYRQDNRIYYSKSGKSGDGPV